MVCKFIDPCKLTSPKDNILKRLLLYVKYTCYHYYLHNILDHKLNVLKTKKLNNAKEIECKSYKTLAQPSRTICKNSRPYP
ncbi:hypothetical protein [Chlamydia ibidis]|uniref:hypothetical protein n=1 Tax=Chlamydia ibidis TaxID=1405396 RepID=UPI0013E0CC3D|nr:hypothetical protein [Chlamydia ibidis]